MRGPKREAVVELVEEPRARIEDVSLPPDADADHISLADMLDTCIAGRWLIAAAVAVALAGGIAYALLATPIFRSDALVHVEDNKAAKGMLGDLSSLLGDAAVADTEIEILSSRFVIGEVVKALHLDIVATATRFPIVGGAIARRHAGGGVAPAPMGLRRYGWGGERIRVDRLEVPAALVGERLELIAGEAGRYTVRGPDGAPLVEGEVGKPASGDGVELFVSELAARPGLVFQLVRVRHDDAVLQLQERLRIREKGKKTGILQLELDGESAERIAATVDALSRAYLRQNVDRRSAEAAKTLEFLEQQLPLQRASLERAEAEYERHRVRTGALDVTLEAQAAVARVAELEKAASELRVEAAALRGRFTDEHPALAAVGMRLRRLEQERDALDARLRKLPAAELESVRRMRDVKVASEIYLSLLNNAQTLKVIKEGTIGNVRILDAAVIPSRPVSPRKPAAVLLALVLGLAAGVGAAFLRRSFDDGVEDPDALERSVGVPVHASIPFSDFQVEHERRARREHRALPLLASDAPAELAVEALRSLRTSLQFALVEARNNVVALSGPAPGVGKSFVSANVAHLLGEAGKRVVIVDADLRRGALHRHFGGERHPGLSDVIGGALPLDAALRDTRSANVRFVASGTIPPNPAELLGSDRFRVLLEDLAGRFDLVIVDTPPILAVTDAALVGRHAGVNLLVVRAGAHPLREISAAVRAFSRNGVRVQGVVMNGVRLDRGLGRRSAYHYQYRYG